mmetsp:Transcript_7071/g.12683  ORF Transcript_7071/g.12683 Transcript_7071/m.12683 type:complete len:619 (-) Transcript_7071:1627-3483(-)
MEITGLLSSLNVDSKQVKHVWTLNDVRRERIARNRQNQKKFIHVNDGFGVALSTNKRMELSRQELSLSEMNLSIDGFQTPQRINSDRGRSAADKSIDENRIERVLKSKKICAPSFDEDEDENEVLLDERDGSDSLYLESPSLDLVVSSIEKHSRSVERWELLQEEHLEWRRNLAEKLVQSERKVNAKEKVESGGVEMFSDVGKGDDDVVNVRMKMMKERYEKQRLVGAELVVSQKKREEVIGERMRKEMERKVEEERVKGEKQREIDEEKRKKEESERVRMELARKEEENERRKEKERRQEERAVKDAMKLSVKEYNYGSKAAYEELKEIESVAQEVIRKCREYASIQGPPTSTMRMGMKKNVNRAINQIAASQKQVLNKMGELHQTLKSAQELGVNALSYCEYTIAQRLVAEAEGQIMLHPQSGFAVASVMAALMAVYPAMKSLVLYEFYMKCMMTLPRHIAREEGQSEEEFGRLLGRKKDEKIESYYERMCGYISLFAALVQTELPIELGIGENPCGIDYGWKWIARICNMKPRNMTCMMLASFLEICGYQLWKSYGFQYQKLMKYVHQNVLQNVPSTAPPGPTSRLKSMLEDYFNSGKMDPPVGKYLPVNDAENE